MPGGGPRATTRATSTASSRRPGRGCGRWPGNWGGTLAQLCLAYVLTNDDLCSVVIGARTTEQIGDDLGAFQLLERVGADRLRELLAPYWLDRGRVDPESSWSSVPDDDPVKYALILPDA
ncbi:hypothetical protein DP939_31935 [Spongiactinospora rosea]|uniref:Aldo/keto reductase family protein n=1 Tax=Spongiactinospora rosea TaxID=2248750 RepID=A0A366LQQ0_9ACTN|nr:hypothetical protein DP939_31935 [Spongiactinospora rosea]